MDFLPARKLTFPTRRYYREEIMLLAQLLMPARATSNPRLSTFGATARLCGADEFITSRRAFLVSGASISLAPSVVPTSAHALDQIKCKDDRCAIPELMSSPRVPSRLREGLKLASRLYDEWNELTSECNGNVCHVTSSKVMSEYLSEESPLLTLATDGALREAFVISLVAADDREVYARNRERFESSMRYVAMSTSLAKYDPPLPSFPKGEYVPKGLTDETGRLRGSSLENARDFLLDALDALVVCCSFIHVQR